MNNFGFNILTCSIFDVDCDAYVNSINCKGAMGAGIALEFKKKYPKMYDDYVGQCRTCKIQPGDCYIYKEHGSPYILGLAVKNDWKHWATKEWILSSIKSLKLAILENSIKIVNMPLIGGKNGRRGPYGMVPNMTPPPSPEEIKTILTSELSTFCNKFNLRINLCIPDNKPVEKITLEKFI